MIETNIYIRPHSFLLQSLVYCKKVRNLITIYELQKY